MVTAFPLLIQIFDFLFSLSQITEGMLLYVFYVRNMSFAPLLPMASIKQVLDVIQVQIGCFTVASL